MAKGSREVVGMICSVCKSQNYTTQRNKTNIQVKSDTGSGKLALKKYCKKCGKMTEHKETLKLK